MRLFMSDATTVSGFNPWFSCGPDIQHVTAAAKRTVKAAKMHPKDAVQLTPWQKWIKHRKFPWKLAVHTLLVLCST